MPRGVRDAVVVLVGLSLFSWMALSAASQKSPVFDEPPHVTAGAAVWLKGDYRLLPESGVLVERWLALPDVVWRPQLSALAGPSWSKSDVWKVDDAFLYDSGNDADALVWRARIMATVAAAILGAVVFWWSRRVNGPLGSWISLTLFVFSPTALAHGPLATADMMAALFFTLGTWALWRLVNRISAVTVVAAGCALAALVLSKFSGPIIVAIAACLVVIQLVRGSSLMLAIPPRTWNIEGRWRVLGTFVVTAVLVGVVVGTLIWGAYGFRYRAFSPSVNDVDATFLTAWSELIDSSTAVGGTLQWARGHHLLPEAFVYGLAQSLKFSVERPAFLNGTFETTGSLAFFPYAFLVKTSVPLLLLAIGGVLATAGIGGPAVLRDRTTRRTDRDSSLVPIWILFGVYSLFALSSHLNIGHRHLLPLYPPLMILAGGLGRWLEPGVNAQTPSSALAVKRRARSRRGRPPETSAPKHRCVLVGSVVAACLVWHMGESLYARPDYLAYVNEIAGGMDNGYRHLVDSSIDWGQDLPGLKRWLDSHRGDMGGQVYFSYFGSARPAYYGISAVMLPSLFDRRTPGLPGALGGGVYCISATMLQAVYLAAPGPWTESYETQYQHLLHNVQAFEATAPNSNERAAAEAALGAAGWDQMFFGYEQFRAARLFAYLRRREPDANIGHSILVFRVTDDEANQAQFGPPPS
jgi:hypothetical protein